MKKKPKGSGVARKTRRALSHTASVEKITVAARVRSCVTRVVGVHGQKLVKGTRGVAVIESDSVSSISSVFLSPELFLEEPPTKTDQSSGLAARTFIFIVT